MSAPALTKRLVQELKSYSKNPQEEYLERLGPVSDDNLTEWEAVLDGVPNSPYEGGRWLLRISIPPTYPLTSPTITFKTRICHPNVSLDSGEICLSLLKEHWSPAYTLAATMGAVYQLLTDPGIDSPLNVDVAALIREGDEVAWDALVRYWTGREVYRGE